MAKCGYCGSSVIVGGVKGGNHRFCNQKCHQAAYILAIAEKVPAEVLNKHVDDVLHSNCPKCGSLGPVDVHKAHQVWSAFVVTHWSSKAHVCCRSCGIKAQAGAALFSFFFGWWGFPWGLVVTPVQIARNIAGMVGGGETTRPSKELQRLIKVHLGTQLLSQQRQAGQTV